MLAPPLPSDKKIALLLRSFRDTNSKLNLKSNHRSVDDLSELSRHSGISSVTLEFQPLSLEKRLIRPSCHVLQIPRRRDVL